MYPSMPVLQHAWIDRIV